MNRLILILSAALSVASVSFAEIQIIDGRKYECRDDGCYLIEDDAPVAPPAEARPSPVAQPDGAVRVAQGYMSADRFVSFLEGREPERPLGDAGIWLTLLLALLGGLAMNLTPCVLPMIPINLLVIGKSAVRGVWYGLGMMLAYGALGLAAAVGGLAFGAIQGNPWFNLGVAAVFLLLAFALAGAFVIDLSRFRPLRPVARSNARTFAFPFFMGTVSAVLAGACVAPILISVLLLTGKLYGEGHAGALALPFVLGLGMALPWPFLGAGLKVLPRPGAWMKWVNRCFAVAVLAFAAHYASLAVRAWTDAAPGRRTAVSRDLDGILRDAKRPLLIDCWATWCKNCKAMESVLSEPRVRKALEPFTVVRLQAEDIAELRRHKGFESIKGLPAFVIFE